MLCDQLKELRDPHKAHFYVKERVHTLLHEAIEIVWDVQADSDDVTLREVVDFLRHERKFLENLRTCVDRVTDKGEPGCNRDRLVAELSYFLSIADIGVH